MREGQTQKILVSDVSEEALRHLLVLIYTGCPDKDLDLVTSGCCFKMFFKSEEILLRSSFFESNSYNWDGKLAVLVPCTRKFT